MSNAILFTTHFIDDIVIDHLNIIKEQIKDADIYVLFNDTENKCTLENENIYYFNSDVVAKHGFVMHYYYPYFPKNVNKEFYKNNFEYGLFCFYKDHPNYNNYWVIEYDVIYTGNWNDLILKYERNDFVSSNILTYNQCKTWHMWENDQLTHYQTIIPKVKIKSFNPIFKISRKALKDLILLNHKGNYGFYEIYFPSVLNQLGYSLKQFDELIGNDQDNPYSSMSYKENDDNNIFLNGDFKNLLIHPVKNIKNNNIFDSSINIDASINIDSIDINIDNILSECVLVPQKAIVTICSDNYVKYVKVLIHSFYRHNQNFDGDFVILYDGEYVKLSNDSKLELLNVNPNIIFHKVDITDYLPIIDIYSKHVCNPRYISCTLKFEIFKLNYDKLLLVDGDTLILNSLDELFSKDYSFAPVEDYGRCIETHLRKYEYFNGGVWYFGNKEYLNKETLMDILQFSINLVNQDCTYHFNYRDANTNELKWFEQDIMNIYFLNKPNVYVLDYSYNQPFDTYEQIPLLTGDFDESKYRIIHYWKKPDEVDDASKYKAVNLWYDELNMIESKSI